MTQELRSHSRDFVVSLEKGLQVLLCFDRKHAKLSLTEVARLTGHTPAAARRFLRTLEALGYLGTDGKRFWVAPRTLLLARPYLASRAAPQVAQPILDKLAERTRQSASLGVMLDNEVLIIGRSTGRRTLSTGLGIGSRLPVFCSAIGRAVLSSLPEQEVLARLSTTTMSPWTPHTVTDIGPAVESVNRCRIQGWAECDEELELGVRSIALPISDPADKTRAAISLSVRAERMGMEAFRLAHLPAIEEAREELIRSRVTFD